MFYVIFEVIYLLAGILLFSFGEKICEDCTAEKYAEVRASQSGLFILIFTCIYMIFCSVNNFLDPYFTIIIFCILTAFIVFFVTRMVKQYPSEDL